METLVRWTWDEDKNLANLQKHRIRFENAMLVFDDPLAVTRGDPYPHERRLQTIGQVRSVVIVVIHTWVEPDNGSSESIGRIISARKATRRERSAYEEGTY